MRNYNPVPLLEIVQQCRPTDIDLHRKLAALSKADFSDSFERGTVYTYTFQNHSFDEVIEIKNWKRGNISIYLYGPERDVAFVMMTWNTSDPKKTDLYIY